MNNILIAIFFSEEHFLLICNKQFQVLQVCTMHEDQTIKKKKGPQMRPVFASMLEQSP